MRHLLFPLALALVSGASVVSGQIDSDIFTLEVPELGIHIVQGGSAVIPGTAPGHVQVRIALPPTQVSYGNVFARVNTEAANTIMTVRGTSNGLLCDLDLTRQQAIRFRGGRNSVEVGVVDNRGRLRYSSFLIDLAAQAQVRRGADPIAARRGSTRHALLIGVARYLENGTGVRNLATADRDASLLRDFLVSPGGGFQTDHVTLLLNEDATASRIRQALATLATVAAPDDMVAIFIAGYGIPAPEDPRRYYLLAHDSRPQELQGTALPLAELEDFFGRSLKARSVATFLDVARPTPFVRPGMSTTTLVHQYLSRLAGGGTRAVLAAADVGQTASAGEATATVGTFTREIVAGLGGSADENRDGTVTFGELSAFVRSEVRRSTGGEQSPVGSPGEGEGLALAGLLARP
ncbi:MAG: hypothetical protein U0Q55_04910 [Vicinamibacterales bacterium]